MLPPLSGPARDVALLVARVLLGVVLFAHGFQRGSSPASVATTTAFTRIGVPIPPASAAYASIIELVGGGLLILGVHETRDGSATHARIRYR